MKNNINYIENNDQEKWILKTISYFGITEEEFDIFFEIKIENLNFGFTRDIYLFLKESNSLYSRARFKASSENGFTLSLFRDIPDLHGGEDVKKLIQTWGINNEN